MPSLPSILRATSVARGKGSARALLLGACLLGLPAALVSEYEIHQSAQTIAAQPAGSAQLSVRRRTLLGLRVRPLEPTEADGLSLAITPPGIIAVSARAAAPGEYDLRATGTPGQTTITLRRGATLVYQGALSAVVPPVADADDDGLPDVAELVSADDRAAFAAWFAAIAESQYQRLDETWNPDQRDCAGLLRFAYVEALRAHDDAWRRRHRLRLGVVLSDVRRFTYPDIPALAAGPFRTGDPATPFGHFATARVLMEHNAVLLGRERRAATTGDLLFFRRDEGGPGALHSMVLLGREQYGDDYVVYHTGPSGAGASRPAGPGEVRKVRLTELMQHPDATWHPVAGNQNFLGYFRWRLTH